MTAALVADERAYQAFVDPKRFRRRARAVRVELDAEKAAAAYFGEDYPPREGPSFGAGCAGVRRDSREAPGAMTGALTVRHGKAPGSVAHAETGGVPDAGEQVPPDGATTAAADSPASSVPAGGVTPPLPAGDPAHPCSLCGATPARLYPMGWRCAQCGPPALPEADPARTAEALAARRERLRREGRLRELLFARAGAV